MRATVTVLFLLMRISTYSNLQGLSPAPPAATFEASVRARADHMDRFSFRVLPSGLFLISNAPLDAIISRAYGIEPMQKRFKLIATSRFQKLLAVRFDIQMKLPENTPAGQENSTLQSLLATRFNLRVHAETRQTPVYALTVARDGKLGPELRRSVLDCAAFRANRSKDEDPEGPRGVHGDRVCTRSYEMNDPKPGAFKIRDAGGIDSLVQRLRGFVDRPVVDATSLTGTFEWVVSFSNDPNEPELPSVFQALQDQLGLKLQRRVDPIGVFVIDSVESPTPN